MTCPGCGGRLEYAGELPLVECNSCHKGFRMQEQQDDRHQEALAYYRGHPVNAYAGDEHYVICVRCEMFVLQQPDGRCRECGGTPIEFSPDMDVPNRIYWRAKA